jgi:hypothetical protein
MDEREDAKQHKEPPHPTNPTLEEKDVSRLFHKRESVSSLQPRAYARECFFDP